MFDYGNFLETIQSCVETFYGKGRSFSFFTQSTAELKIFVLTFPKLPVKSKANMESVKEWVAYKNALRNLSSSVNDV